MNKISFGTNFIALMRNVNRNGEQKREPVVVNTDNLRLQPYYYPVKGNGEETGTVVKEFGRVLFISTDNLKEVAEQLGIKPEIKTIPNAEFIA